MSLCGAGSLTRSGGSETRRYTFPKAGWRETDCRFGKSWNRVSVHAA
jgi:hypothetical protein